MPVYNCPLCKQTVSREIYEEITGIWKEREKQLSDLKIKEKALAKKAKDIQSKYEKDKVKLEKKHQGELKARLGNQQAEFKKKWEIEKKKLDVSKKKIENAFEKKLASATRRIMAEEQKKQKSHLKLMEAQLKNKINADMEKQQTKFRKEKERIERQQKLQRDRNTKLLKQYQSLQSKSEKQLEAASKKIISLQEQIDKNQSPQMLGLLEERGFLASLKAEFPNDEFIHTGKGGDILHHVKDGSSKTVGTIVYELKKVARFSNSHVTQTRMAKEQRDAEYGILITNAKRKKQDSGFGIVRGVIIIHPAGAIVLITILRNNLLDIAKLKLSKLERDKTIKSVLEYIQGPSFANSVDVIVQDTIDLHSHLEKEVLAHLKQWEYRFDKYKKMNTHANKIDSKVIRLLLEDTKKVKISARSTLTPIVLPEKID